MVWQTLELEEAGIVSIYNILCLCTENATLWLTDNLDVAQCRTVGHADITADASCRLTLGTHDLGRGYVQALTLQNTLHAVVVGLLCQYFLVLVILLNQVGSHGVSPLGIGIRTVRTAQYTIEVCLTTADPPRQTNAALLLLWGNAGNLVHVHELIDSLIASLLLGHRLRHFGQCAAGNLQWRRAAPDNQVEVIVHTLARQVIRKLVLLNGFGVTRQINLAGFSAVSSLHLHLQYQLGTPVPKGDNIMIVNGCIHHRTYAVLALTPGFVAQRSTQLRISHSNGRCSQVAHPCRSHEGHSHIILEGPFKAQIRGQTAVVCNIAIHIVAHLCPVMGRVVVVSSIACAPWCE